MRVLRLSVVLVFALLAVGSVYAQSDMAAELGILIDTHVELQGFPTTGSQIEAARQEVAQNISTQINYIHEQIGELDGESSVGHVYVEALDEAAQSSTPRTAAEQFDSYRPRPQIDTVTGRDSRPDMPEYDGPPNELVELIKDSVRDIFSDDGSGLPDYQASSAPHQRTQLDVLMERYGKEIAKMQGELALNEQQRRQLAEATADAAGDLIDQKYAQRQALMKRMIRRYIQVMTASHEVPISGYWRVVPYEYSRSGACEIYTGDNGGMGLYDNEQDPGQPLCGYGDPDNGQPFLTWNGQEHDYLPGTSSIYSAGSRFEQNIVRGRSGETLRSMITVQTTDYEVVAPDRIIVHDYIQEVGGCSLSADYVLELVRQDETVCNLMDVDPEVTPEPVSTPPPPEEPKKMRVGQQFTLDEQECDAGNTPPSFDEVTLTPHHDGSLLLDYGSGTYTLYSDGGGYYEYSNGQSVSPEVMISVVLQDDGGASISWTIQADSGKRCYVTRDLLLPGQEDQPGPFSTPDPNVVSTPDVPPTEAPVIAVVPGRYKVEWNDVPGLCPEDMKPDAPSFAEVDVALPDDKTVSLDYDGGQAALDMMAANVYMTSVSGDPLSITTSVQPTAPGVLAYSWIAQQGSAMCLTMATLTLLPDD